VLTPADFEELSYREFAKAKIRSGLASAKLYGTTSATDVRKHLKDKVRAAAHED
jgi:hypothetical protein